jgi:hypothetical protein
MKHSSGDPTLQNQGWETKKKVGYGFIRSSHMGVPASNSAKSVTQPPPFNSKVRIRDVLSWAEE